MNLSENKLEYFQKYFCKKLSDLVNKLMIFCGSFTLQNKKKLNKKLQTDWSLLKNLSTKCVCVCGCVGGCGGVCVCVFLVQRLAQCIHDEYCQGSPNSPTFQLQKYCF